MIVIEMNYKEICKKIEDAQGCNKLYPLVANKVRLVAVSKQQEYEKIECLLKQGHRVFGENKIQEAELKWKKLKHDYADIELHMIGKLQTNKTKEAIELFDVIETLENEKQVIMLAKEQQKQNKKLKYFIQVNIGNENQKSGIRINELSKFYVFCKEQDLDVIGLMCIPPVNCNPAPYFALMRHLLVQTNLKELSMGMSSDYEIAIKLGATHVRIGTLLFGNRSY